MCCYNQFMGRSKRTVILSVILGVLIVYALAVYVVKPLYIQHWRHYEIHGGMTEELRSSELLSDLQSGRSVCFIGDSITEGNEIEGVHWYQPLIPYVEGDLRHFSHGGWTVQDVTGRSDDIPASDIYVIALGVNDIINDYPSAAPDAEEYASRMRQLADILENISPDCKLYYVAPWPVLRDEDDIPERAHEFTNELEEFCRNEGHIFINPCPAIIEAFGSDGMSAYMLPDGIHPNDQEGVGLYSYAVLLSDSERT